jgi:hypothetical protein
MTKNSPFRERLTHSVSQRSSPSRTATAYRCSPGTCWSLIGPTLGLAKMYSLALSKKLPPHCQVLRRGRRHVEALIPQPSLERMEIILADKLHCTALQRPNGQLTIADFPAPISRRVRDRLPLPCTTSLIQIRPGWPMTPTSVKNLRHLTVKTTF